jgi:6-phosphofructokinase 1
MQAGQIQFHSLEDLPRMSEQRHRRPKEQWWMDLRPIARVLAQPTADVAQGNGESSADS